MRKARTVFVVFATACSASAALAQDSGTRQATAPDGEIGPRIVPGVVALTANPTTGLAPGHAENSL